MAEKITRLESKKKKKKVRLNFKRVITYSVLNN